jgi:hypothetical protein
MGIAAGRHEIVAVVAPADDGAISRPDDASMLLATAAAAHAANAGSPELVAPAYKPPVVKTGYTSPTFGDDYVAKLKQLPDWNGSWFITGGYLFDPSNSWMPSTTTRPSTRGRWTARSCGTSRTSRSIRSSTRTPSRTR